MLLLFKELFKKFPGGEYVNMKKVWAYKIFVFNLHCFSIELRRFRAGAESFADEKPGSFRRRRFASLTQTFA
jgi:hypothetical protein